MNAALVHYWLINRRGGEVVVEALGELLPDADLISHVIDPKVLFGSLEGRELIETFVSRLPAARRHYKKYLPFMPIALEVMDMSKYDLIVSSEAGPAKWIIPNPDAYHVCYCHSPMRYLWDQRDIYFRQIPAFLRPLAHLYASHLRHSDILSATRVDQFVANSDFVAKRIWKYYRRESQIVHPPVDLRLYSPAAHHDDFYLVAGEIVPYKRVDLAVRACTALNRRLKIVGGGNLSDLRKIAGPTVEFIGRVSDVEFRAAMQQCRALLFPGLEDFGLVPLEVMASGRPVIAYARGGATETVSHGSSGILFAEQSEESLTRAILEFEAEEGAFTAAACIEQASKFDRPVFMAKMSAIIGVKLSPIDQQITDGTPQIQRQGAK
jgi:glycosyltransferase involved in cell wall biosynthesis